MPRKGQFLRREIPFDKRGGGPDGVLAVPLDEALPNKKETNFCTRKESINPRPSGVRLDSDGEPILMWVMPTSQEDTFECLSVGDTRENHQAGSSAAMRLVKFTINEVGILVMSETEDSVADLD